MCPATIVIIQVFRWWHIWRAEAQAPGRYRSAYPPGPPGRDDTLVRPWQATGQDQIAAQMCRTGKMHRGWLTIRFPLVASRLKREQYIACVTHFAVSRIAAVSIMLLVGYALPSTANSAWRTCGVDEFVLVEHVTDSLQKALEPADMDATRIIFICSWFAKRVVGRIWIIPGSITLDFRSYAAASSQARRMTWISSGVGGWGRDARYFAVMRTRRSLPSMSAVDGWALVVYQGARVR
jgi:hypothetical protein